MLAPSMIEVRLDHPAQRLCHLSGALQILFFVSLEDRIFPVVHGFVLSAVTANCIEIC